MKKSKFSIAGMIVGLVLIIVGIVVWAGDSDDISSGARPSAYDSGYAEFGADFYTYVSNNANYAAVGANRAANNIVGLYGFMKTGFGVFFIALGLLSICYFGNHLLIPPYTQKADEFPALTEEPRTEEPAPAADTAGEGYLAEEVVSPDLPEDKQESLPLG